MPQRPSPLSLPHSYRGSLIGAVLLLILLLLLPGTPAAAQERASRDAAFWAAAGTTFVGAVLLDQSIRGQAADRGEDLLVPLSEIGYRLGQAKYSLPVIGAVYVTGWLSEEDRLSTAAINTAAALLAAGTVNGALKVGVGRLRPNAEGRSGAFRPLNPDDTWQSFPSGHTVVAFSLAAAVAEQADQPWVSVLSYGTAGVVGWSRLYEDRHWSSDVVGGAVVGIVTSKATVRWLEARERRNAGVSGARLTVLPTGLAVTIPTR